jgi:SAM-dependent methyltransferase
MRMHGAIEERSGKEDDHATINQSKRHSPCRDTHRVIRRLRFCASARPAAGGDPVVSASGCRRGSRPCARDWRWLGSQPAALQKDRQLSACHRAFSQTYEDPRRNASVATGPVELIQGSAEVLPLGDASIDTVVTTWTLCTIPDPRRALGEARRVLRPGGRLVFVEHGRAPELGVARWQDRLDPIWSRVAGGCHLNRRVDSRIEDAGFRIDRLETSRVPGPKTHTFFYEGAASS